MMTYLIGFVSLKLNQIKMFHMDVDGGHLQIVERRLNLLHHDWRGTDEIMSTSSMNRNVSL